MKGRTRCGICYNPVDRSHSKFFNSEISSGNPIAVSFIIIYPKVVNVPVNSDPFSLNFYFIRNHTVKRPDYQDLLESQEILYIWGVALFRRNCFWKFWPPTCYTMQNTQIFHIFIISNKLINVACNRKFPPFVIRMKTPTTTEEEGISWVPTGWVLIMGDNDAVFWRFGNFFCNYFFKLALLVFIGIGWRCLKTLIGWLV